MTTLIYSYPEWKRLKERIQQEYGDKIFLISWRLQRELGFTVRNHKEWIDKLGILQRDIRLDFKDPAQATFFKLKYTEQYERNS